MAPRNCFLGPFPPCGGRGGPSNAKHCADERPTMDGWAGLFGEAGLRSSKRTGRGVRLVTVLVLSLLALSPMSIAGPLEQAEKDAYKQITPPPPPPVNATIYQQSPLQGPVLPSSGIPAQAVVPVVPPQNIVVPPPTLSTPNPQPLPPQPLVAPQPPPNRWKEDAAKDQWKEDAKKNPWAPQAITPSPLAPVIQRPALQTAPARPAHIPRENETTTVVVPTESTPQGPPPQIISPTAAEPSGPPNIYLPPAASPTQPTNPYAPGQ